MSERPVHFRPRRLADWLNPTAAKKVHSLVDKVYQRKNLQMAWERVKANRGSGGVDGQSLEAFAAQAGQQLDRFAARTPGGHLPAPAGAAGADPEGRQAGGVSCVGHPDGAFISHFLQELLGIDLGLRW
jgi:hypothetical protein